MKLHFFGGAGTVTGACYLLEVAGKKILMECGLLQGEAEADDYNNSEFKFNPAEIDAVVVSHSHLDHIGRLPQLVKAGFEEKIYATPPTVDFARIILEDSIKILEEKARHAGVIPIFGDQEVDQIMKHFVPVDYYKKTEILPGVLVEFFNAGHILGSAVIKIAAEGQIIVFSGDLGNPSSPLLKAPDFLEEADYVLIESAYGDRNHESPEKAKEIIEDVVEDAVANKGVLLIPSFALERTQQLLYHLNELVENHKVPAIPVYFDSPLALRATSIYAKYPHYYNKEATDQIRKGDDIFTFPGLNVTRSSEESKAINNVDPPKIIIAGSGMSQGGRILHHEQRYLSDPKTIMLFVTYQAAGTLGRRIFDGDKKVKILDQEISVKARIEKISGYSSHADQKFLLEWLNHFQKPCYPDIGEKCGRLKKVWIVQGERSASEVLATLVRDQLGVEAEVPQLDQSVELTETAVVGEAIGVK